MIKILEGVEQIRLDVEAREHPPRGERPDAVTATGVDAKALAAALRSRVKGEVRFESGDRALYSTDSSNYRQIPLGVVIPLDADDVIETVAVCREFGAPILSRGCATSLAGQTTNAAVVIDFSKHMNHVLQINYEEKWAIVEPGCVDDDLRDLAEKRGLTFGPDPSTHNRCTLGGMIGNNSCGIHAQMAGRTERNVIALEVLTYDGLRMWVGKTSPEELAQIIAEGGRRGEIYRDLQNLIAKYGDEVRARFPLIPRRISGYPLEQLLPDYRFNVAGSLVGTEGTCVVILRAKLRLVDSPPHRVLAIAGFPDVFTAGDAVPFINTFAPIAVEGIDRELFDYLAAKGQDVSKDLDALPAGNGWIMVEFGAASKAEADAKAKEMTAAFEAGKWTGGPKPHIEIIDDEQQEKSFWKIREEGLGSTAKIPGRPDYWPGWEDSACPPDKVGPYLRDLKALFQKYGYDAAVYGHFGQGCIHCRATYDLSTAEGIETWKRFLREAAHLVVSYGGSLSGEHGDGQARGELLPIMYGDSLVNAFREFKRIWDPGWKMNPGKVVDPYPVDMNLRIGVNYNPWEPKTHFSFMEDRGRFSYAADRCVGTGKCRRHDSGVMCPSYMATREEKHSTRGRARLLWEMLEGGPLNDGWKSKPVYEALELCLSCKGCKSECPVNVDMATYKAEFLSHYFEGRMRPVHAYAFGLIMYWAHLASKAPWLVNTITHTPGLAQLAKAAATMAQPRTIPLFAEETFKSWFAKRPVHNLNRPKVILWPDTFNNHFHAETAKHAVEVLEAAGFQVIVPKATLCCGRPLYDYGMLDLAKTFLLEILDELRPHIRAGVPVVGLEPSCVSVFKDEMCNLLHGVEDATRLKEQTYMLTEFLARKAPDFTPPPLKRKALVHGHCHHKTVLDMHTEEQIFKKMQLDVEMPDDGCCGMAGAFGFEKGKHYDVSIACGERKLLPKVREATETTLIVSDGFSCRQQIWQTTDRQALHSADVLKMAMEQGPAGPPGPKPELHYMPDETARARAYARRGMIALGVIGAASALLVAGALRGGTAGS